MCIVAQLCAYVHWLGPGDHFSDLRVYVGATRDLLAGRSLYDYAGPAGEGFTYPPFAGYLFSWLPLVPSRVLGVTWLVLTTAALVVMALAVVAACRTDEFPGNRRLAFRGGNAAAAALVCTLVLLSSAPGRSNATLGQASALIVALTLADLFLVSTRRRGYLLGCAIAIKLTPLAFVPLLVLVGRRRQAAIASITAAVLTAAALLADPRQSAHYWAGELFESGRFGKANAAGNQSIRACLERAHIHSTGVWLLLAATVMAVATIVAWRLYGRGGQSLAVSCIGAGSLLASPISWTHHQFWLLVPGLCLLREAGVAVKAWAACLVAVMFVGPVDGLSGLGPLGWVVSNLHMLAAFCVLGAAALCLRRGRDRLPVTELGPEEQPADRREKAWAGA